MTKQAMLKIQLVKSPIACNQSQRDTVRSLGLTRLYQCKELPNLPAVRGMVKKVIHLLDVLEDPQSSGR